jgi:hypothetical protein
MDTNTNPNFESTISKFNQIFDLILEIEAEEPLAGQLLRESYTLSINTLAEIGKLGNRDQIDISEHIAIISRVLGVDIQAMMENTFRELSSPESTKEADAATLEFITSDLDDYERFIAQAKAKENLDFLSKEI